MEKRESQKTITIKINGKKQTFDEPDEKEDRKPLQIIDSRNEEIPSKKAEQKVEEESISKEETAAAHDSSDESFDWILPEIPDESDINEYKISSKTPKTKKKKPYNFNFGKQKIERTVFTTIFTAVLLAVILGTSFGFIMLKLVFIEKPSEPAAVQVPAPITEQKPEQNQNGGAQTLTLPSFSSWLVQGGVFSNRDSANKIVTSLKATGLSATVLENNGQSYLFLGVADTKDHAKYLGSDIENREIEAPFAKEMSFGGKEISGLNQQEKQYLEAVPLLFETMATAASTAALNEDVPKTLIDSINAQREKLDDGSKITNEKIKEVKVHVDGAVKDIGSLQKSAGEKEKTSLQQHLLSLLASYQSL